MLSTNGNKQNTQPTMDFFSVMKFDWEHIWNFYTEDETIGKLRISYSPINIKDREELEIEAFLNDIDEYIPDFPRNEWVKFDLSLCVNTYTELPLNDGYIMIEGSGDNLKFKD